MVAHCFWNVSRIARHRRGAIGLDLGRIAKTEMDQVGLPGTEAEVRGSERGPVLVLVLVSWVGGGEGLLEDYREIVYVLVSALIGWQVLGAVLIHRRPLSDRLQARGDAGEFSARPGFVWGLESECKGHSRSPEWK